VSYVSQGNKVIPITSFAAALAKASAERRKPSQRTTKQEVAGRVT